MVNEINIVKLVNGEEVKVVCSACGYEFEKKDEYHERQCPRCSAPFKKSGVTYDELVEVVK